MNQELSLLDFPLHGSRLIEANAGTGKTYSLECLFLRLLVEKENIEVSQILVVTFTEAATEELRQRIYKRLKLAFTFVENQINATQVELKTDPFLNEWLEKLLRGKNQDSIILVKNRLKLALLSFDEASIYTIHGFCHKILTDYKVETRSPYEIELVKNPTPFLREVCNDFWRNHAYSPTKEFVRFFCEFFSEPDKILQEFRVLLNRLDLQILPHENKTIQEIYSENQQALEELKEVWNTSKEDLVQGLLEQKEFFQPKFKESFEDWLEELNQTFSSIADGFSSPVSLKSFTGDFIRKKVQKKNLDQLVVKPFFDLVQAYVEFLSGLKARVTSRVLLEIQKLYEEKKKDLGICTFDDLLTKTYSALKGPFGENLANKIRQRYRSALIDEFQDTDTIQTWIFQKVFDGKSPFICIGDPKQSIYNFRGADVFAYFNAAKKVDSKHYLLTNYRSDARLVKAINSIFENEESDQFLFSEMIRYRSSKTVGSSASFRCETEYPSSFQLYFFHQDDFLKTQDAKRKIIDSTVAEIIRLLNLGQKGLAGFEENSGDFEALAAKDITILVRTHEEGRQFYEELTSEGIPVVLKTKSNVLQSRELTILFRFLNAVYNYKNLFVVRAALISEFFSYSAEDIDNFNHDPDQQVKITREFKEYFDWAANEGIVSMLHHFLRKRSIRAHLVKQQYGERKITNVLHLIELFQEVQSERKLSFPGFLRWMKRVESEGIDEEQSQLRLESDQKALQIMTLHASKGLEFPIVFCPFVWTVGSRSAEAVFHDPQDHFRQKLDLNKTSASQKIIEQENLAEQIRLAYVAMTRAKYACYVSWGKINQTGKSCFTYLFHRSIFAQRSFNKIESSQFLKDLKELEKIAEGNIKVSLNPSLEREKYQKVEEEQPELRVAKFTGKLGAESKIESFSSLINKSDQSETLDFEEIVEESEEVESENLFVLDPKNLSMLNFPKGADTGNFFHEILEELNFAKIDEDRFDQLIDEKLEDFEIDPKWKKLSKEAIQEIIHYPLKANFGEVLKLSDLNERDIIKEFGFYLDSHLDKTKLLSLFSEQKTKGFILAKELASVISSIPEHNLKSMLTGYIDVVFQHQEIYYIIDWKTNYLGPAASDYSTSRIEISMRENQYFLQAFLYALALHKYLKFSKADYSFEKNFGGVFYFYLRGIGMNEEANYFIQPEEFSFLDNL